MTADEIIRTIKKLAAQKGQDYLSLDDFKKEAGISEYWVQKTIGNWNDAIRLAGLRPLGPMGDPNRKRGYTVNDVKKALVEVYQDLDADQPMSFTLFSIKTGISYTVISRLFGSWEKLMAEFGIRRHPQHMKKVTRDDIMIDYLCIFDELGRLPTAKDLIRHSAYSQASYFRKFGSFKNVREQSISYGMKHGLIDEAEGFELLNAMDALVERVIYNTIPDRVLMGDTLNFRSLQHAPTSETGVIFVFGMLFRELGFVVEHISPEFPDCDAKRRTFKGAWQRVKIEFEYRSKNFLEHGHDISKCDIIICWEHNWDDCPLEVIPLKEKVGLLESSQ